MSAELLDAARFWSYVDKSGANGCWLWTGALFGGTGYGSMYVGPRRRGVGAHRVSWELHFGAIPDGLCVLHRCDNRPCVRPEHLFLGTRADNIADCYAKGRTVQQTRRYLMARGERVSTAKLTESQVIKIRLQRADGRSVHSLAREYGVSYHAIKGVVTRATWRHVV